MYKPPENCNRVKAIRLKFEGNAAGTLGEQNLLDCEAPKPKIKQHSAENAVVSNKHTQILNRQLSDPVKRNIKRSPAFRLDKNAFKEREHIFQRNGNYSSVKNGLDKFKSLNDTSRLTSNCDNGNTVKSYSRETQGGSNLNENVCNIEFDDNFNVELKEQCTNMSDYNSEENSDLLNECLKMLYSEPIPKSQRNRTCESIQKAATLKLNSTPPKEDKIKDIKIETAQNVIDILKNIDPELNGSDTIKKALNRPLPKGPAPKKPPRTFQHPPRTALSKSELNISSLNLDDGFTHKLNKTMEKRREHDQKSKKDPKYMLEKLENAIKNHKLKLRRQQRVDVSSEDENETKRSVSPILSKSFSSKDLFGNQKFNLNCLNTLGCSRNPYADVPEPNSKFWTNGGKEPIYAEPFEHDVVRRSKTLDSNEMNGKKQRNSLYYMSNPVLGLDLVDGTVTSSCNRSMEQHNQKEQLLNNQCETSSLSTFSSDSDSNASTPVDNANTYVKDLIKSFEDKRTVDVNVSDGIKLRSRSLVAGNSKSNRYAVVCSVDRKKRKQVERTESKFEIYLRTVRPFSIKTMSNTHLFHCCLLVGLDEKRPYIKFKFPSNIEVPPYIENFCFPDSEDQRINCSFQQQCYSLVITDASGDRIYGYCRRVLPEGSSTCLPLAYCILTKHRAPRFYRRILQELESHHGLPDKQRNDLINEFYNLTFPKPGHSIRLDLGKIVQYEIKSYNTQVNENNNDFRKFDDSLNGISVVESDSCPHGIYNIESKTLTGSNCKDCPICSNVKTNELVLTLHQDMRYEETDLKELCNTLTTSSLLKVFEYLLLERKVIFASCHLSTLSSCIEAVQSVLYPFSWPHAFIPVLPKSRWEIVEAPAPLICGVLSAQVVNEFKIENAIVVDLDTNEILLEMRDDDKILPETAVKTWKKGLGAARDIKTTDDEHNVLLSDAFIRVFISTCGHYKDFIVNNVFDKEGFKNFPKSKSIRRFLQWFTQTTMFDMFIDAVLSNPNSFYIFDSRIKIYSSQDATLILEKMRDWKKI